MGSPKIVQPTPPPAPSVSDNINAYVEAQPKLFELQQQQAPQEIAQQLELLQQYGAPYAEAYKDIQARLYPETTALQEDLAKQAQQGYTSGLTESARNMYRDEFKALVGDQARAGIGANYISSNLVNQDLAYRQYNQNLALSLAGRQPLTNPYQPQFTNQVGQFAPGDVMAYNQGIYGSQLAFSKPFQSQSNVPGYLAGGGAVLSGLGSWGGQAGMMAALGGCWVASEVFGGWYRPKTVSARAYINNDAPKWFKKFYLKYGERIAKFISDKPIFKAVLRPLFELFAWKGNVSLSRMYKQSLMA